MDNRQGKELAATLQSMLAKPPEQLAKLARENAAGLQASLTHDRTIARLRKREECIERLRIDLLKLADQQAEARHKEREDLDGHIKQTRQQFEGDSQRCEQELIALIDSYREVLQRHKKIEDGYRLKASQADAALAKIRTLLVQEGQARRKTQLGSGPLDIDAVPGLLNLDLDFKNEDPLATATAASAEAAAAAPGGSVDEALKSIDALSK